MTKDQMQAKIARLKENTGSAFARLWNRFVNGRKKDGKIVAGGRFGRQFARNQVRQSIAYQWGSMYKQDRDFSYPKTISGFPQRNRNFRRSKYNGKGELI